MIFNRTVFIVLTALFFLISACRRDKDFSVPGKPDSFNRLSGYRTGINNWMQRKVEYDKKRIFEPLSVNAADFNNDGLVDLLFSGAYNIRLYYNDGGFKFREATDSVGLGKYDEIEKNAALTVADVNGDGFPDIYVCKSVNPFSAGSKGNLLFINHAGNVFTESSAEYGLNKRGYCKDAAFFDYDNDRDLDLVLGFWPHSEKGEMIKSLNYSFEYYNSGDTLLNEHPHLYENTGGAFKDVTLNAGLSLFNSFTNNVSVADINGDGYLDVFIANDFIGRDYLYINKGDKTFSEIARAAMSRSCLGSMGVDIADINNDLKPDIMVAEMLPADKIRQKLSFTPYAIDFYKSYSTFNSIPQYQKNSLFINTNGTEFSETAFQAGVAATDWSWAPLLADFDNDGNRDLFVSSGIGIDILNVDFIKGIYGKDIYAGADQVGISTDVKKYLTGDELVRRLTLRLRNHMFKNTGNGEFTDVSGTWGLNDSLNSFGAAYADLDNDGDLDLITNNLHGPPCVYENNLDKGNYLRLKLKGKGLNTDALGSKVIIYYGNEKQLAEIGTKRGFISNSEPVAHFGLGKTRVVDSVKIEWLGGGVQTLYNVRANQQLNLTDGTTADTAGRAANVNRAPSAPALLSEVTNKLGVNFVHRESEFIDYKRERLIPRKISREGPCLAVGDVNGDKLDDFYVGGAAGQSGALYLQTSAGFTKSAVQDMYRYANAEETGALFFDADKDGDLDLCITGGSNEFKENDSAIRTRLYFNNGRGIFHYDSLALPIISEVTKAVAAADFDGDGDLDLFIGGRLRPGNYPLPPKSFLLQNNGKGAFTDVTAAVAPALQQPGLITGAVWADIDGDAKPELVVCGEWMGIGIYGFNGKQLMDKTKSYLPGDTRGWWNTIAAVDVDGDGDLDLLAGNLGQNSTFKASGKEPITILAKDFDKNKTTDAVVFRYIAGVNTPFVNRDVFCEAMPFFSNRYYNYAQFASATFNNLFTKEELAGAYEKQITELRSCMFINNGAKGFEKRPLPAAAQVSVCNDFTTGDIDGDNVADIIVAGNADYGYYEYPAYDAMKGLVLKGTGNGRFKPIDFTQSGYYVPGFASAVKMLYHKGKGRQMVLVANDNAAMQVFEYNPAKK